MKKVAFLALGLLIVLSLLGCNTQGKSEARDILDKSISKMNALSSFRETDINSASTSEGASTSTQKAEYNLSENKSHVVITEDIDGTTASMTTYSYRGYSYTNFGTAVNSNQWQRQKMKSGSVGSSWLAQVTKISKNPRLVRLVSENSTSYRLSLDAKQELLNLMLSGDVNTNLKVESDFHNSAVEKGKVYLTVTKDTMYLEQADISVDMAGIPEVGNMSLKFDLKFYDFNRPVNIVLPEAAKSASGK